MWSDVANSVLPTSEPSRRAANTNLLHFVIVMSGSEVAITNNKDEGHKSVAHLKVSTTLANYLRPLLLANT